MGLKHVAKRFFEKNQRIYRSKAIYKLQRLRQKGNIEPDYDNCNYKDILREIDLNGCTIIENFIPPDIINKILVEVEAPYLEMQAGKKNDDFWHSEGGNGRIGNIDKYSPLAKEYLFDSQMISNLAKSYVSKSAVGFRKEADFKYSPGESYQADVVHIDDWRHRFKAFVLLHDLERVNAPLVYYKGSHKSAHWRQDLEYSYHKDGQSGRFGHLFPQEMRKIQSEHHYESVHFEGKAGSLFLGDFRGLHSGSILMEGKRVMLNYTWGLV